MASKSEEDGAAVGIVIGAAAGIIATAAMTIAAATLFKRMPSRERYPLPPREIGDQVLARLRLDKLDETSRMAFAVGSHFLFGGAAGALLGSGPKLLQGRLPAVIFAGLVWAASYFGWIPAFGLLRPATHHPFRRNLLMILVHAIWGSTLSESIRQLRHSLDPLRGGVAKDAYGRRPGYRRAASTKRKPRQKG